MSDLNRILKQIINLQSKTLTAMKETTIVKETIDNDYTSWEVYPHENEIPKGQNEELDRFFRVPVPANMTESFYIRSKQLQDKQNVIIDWGDGSEYTKLSEFQNELSRSEGDWRYLVSHTYNQTWKYIIKIYGNTYFALLHNEFTSNLMCRVFDIDLPTASLLVNYSSFAGCTQLLTNVNMFNANNFNKNARNISNLFSNCQNMLNIFGFYNSAWI